MSLGEGAITLQGEGAMIAADIFYALSGCCIIPLLARRAEISRKANNFLSPSLR